MSGWRGRAAFPKRLRVQAWHSSGAVASSVYPPSGCGGIPRIAVADPVAERQATGSCVNGLGSGRLRLLRKDRGVPFRNSLTVAGDSPAHESGHRLTFRLREAAGQTSHGASRPYRRNRRGQAGETKARNNTQEKRTKTTNNRIEASCPLPLRRGRVEIEVSYRVLPLSTLTGEGWDGGEMGVAKGPPKHPGQPAPQRPLLTA